MGSGCDEGRAKNREVHKIRDKIKAQGVRGKGRCEDSKVWDNLFCMEGRFLGIQRLVEKNDMLSADMVIERLELECNELNAECGCH